MDLLSLIGRKILTNAENSEKLMEEIQGHVQNLSHDNVELYFSICQQEPEDEDANFIKQEIVNFDKALAIAQDLPFAALVTYISAFISILERQLKTYSQDTMK